MHRELLLVLALTATPFSAALLSRGPTDAQRVLLLGDSVSMLAAGERMLARNGVAGSGASGPISLNLLANAGTGAWGPLHEADGTEAEWRTVISGTIQPGAFDAVIVELATSDCSGFPWPRDAATDTAAITGAISAADPSVPIYWLTVSSPADSSGCEAIARSELALIL